MDMPKNRFKARLKAGEAQLGLWCSLGGPTVAEMLATTGFDWITIDTEHAPAEVTDVLPALQALAAYPEVSPIVRPAINDSVLIKRHLDQGAQTLILPYVQTKEEAEQAVAAVRYPPHGIRGVAGLTRASRYGTVKDYAAQADAEVCLIVQVETVSAMEQLEDIAGVDGVDGIFFGPSDLSASMGLTGQPNHPDVKAAIRDALSRLAAIGVPGGALCLDPAWARDAFADGAAFVAVGLDLHLLSNAARSLRTEFD